MLSTSFNSSFKAKEFLDDLTNYEKNKDMKEKTSSCSTTKEKDILFF